MTYITQADRDAAASFIQPSDGDFELLASMFAAHRLATLDAVAKALKAAQYSPAPYTDCMAAIRKMKEDGA